MLYSCSLLRRAGGTAEVLGKIIFGGFDMTKVKIDPGICGFITAVDASSEDGMEGKVRVRTGCKSVKGMMDALGDTFDSYEVCLVKPGEGPFYEYAQEHFPVHVACPVINGIIKCIEAECHLALKKDAHIIFDKDQES